MSDPPDDRITIRLATLLDVDALFAMHRESLRALCRSAYSAEQLAVWFEGRTSAIYRETIDGRRLWLAERDGDIVGFVGFEPGEVTFLFVAEAVAGRGLGKRLFVLGLEGASRDFDGPLDVLSTLNALRFYEGFGFAAVGDETIFRGFARLPIAVVRMRRA